MDLLETIPCSTYPARPRRRYETESELKASDRLMSGRENGPFPGSDVFVDV